MEAQVADAAYKSKFKHTAHLYAKYLVSDKSPCVSIMTEEMLLFRVLFKRM